MPEPTPSASSPAPPVSLAAAMPQGLAIGELRALIGMLREPVALIDVESMSYAAINAATCEMLGYTEQDLMRDGLRLALPYDPEATRAMYARLIAEPSQPRAGPATFLMRNGREILLHVVRQAIQVQGRWMILINSWPVHDPVEDARRLRTFRAAMDQVSEGIYLIDPWTLSYIDFNDAGCRLLGFTREELFKIGPAGLRGGADAAGLRRRYDHLISIHPQATEDESSFQRKDGTLIATFTTRRAVRDGERWLILLTLRDLSAERRILAHMQRFRAAMDQSAESILLVDQETMTVVDANTTACTFYGASRDDLLSMAPWQLSVRTNSNDELRVLYDEVIRAHPSAHVFETQARRRDGALIDIEVSQQAMRSEDRWIILSSSRDITERKAAQTRMERLAAMMDLSADAMFITDVQDMRLIEVNEVACRLYGFGREEFLRQPMWRAGTEYPTPESVRAVYDRVIAAAPDAVRDETVAMRADGHTFPIEMQRRALRIGGRWMMLSITRDITERKAAEAALRRFRIALDHTVDGVVLVDRETMRFLDANAMACQRAGLTREQFLATPPHMRRPDTTHEQLEQLYDELIASSPRIDVREDRLVQSDGQIIPVEISRTALHIDGRWTIVAVTRDITERKRAEAELRQRMDELQRSNRELEQFAYVASHDLSEPLRMVASYIQLLDRRYGQNMDGDARDFMGFVKDGAHRMMRMIEDLLMYSRAGRTAKPPRQLDMNEVLDDALANLARLVQEKSAQIERGPLPTLTADRNSMIMLLQNLVGNALKFCTDRPPVVRITAQEEPAGADGSGKPTPAGWVISVADNGIGIDPRHFERIFQIFQRLHARDQYEGTGIGLAVCKRIVDYHGGRIWVESQPGQGASFRFFLPAQSPRAAGTTPAATQAT